MRNELNNSGLLVYLENHCVTRCRYPSAFSVFLSIYIYIYMCACVCVCVVVVVVVYPSVVIQKPTMTCSKGEQENNARNIFCG